MTLGNTPLYLYLHVGTPSLARKEASNAIGQLKSVVVMAAASDLFTPLIGSQLVTPFPSLSVVPNNVGFKIFR